VPAQALPPRYTVLIGNHRIRAVPFYAAAKPGELVAVVGSAGLLEVSVRNGSAADATGVVRGAAVTVLED
jgi:S-adenosylmethionine hydrolase